MSQQNPTLKKAMIAAMRKSLGVVTTAAEKAGIDRSTHYEWLKTDPAYKAEIEALVEVKRDFVESKLMTLVNAGDTSATIFCAKVLLKKRGYIERDVYVPEEGEETESVVQLSNGRTLRL